MIHDWSRIFSPPKRILLSILRVDKATCCLIVLVPSLKSPAISLFVGSKAKSDASGFELALRTIGQTRLHPSIVQVNTCTIFHGPCNWKLDGNKKRKSNEAKIETQDTVRHRGKRHETRNR